MVADCRDCPLRRKPLFDGFSETEIVFMQKFKTGEMEVDPGTTLMLEGSNSPQLYTALSGMGLRYKTLLSGERQVINFVLPGDFIGLQAGVMHEMQHSVEATTAMKLCVFDRRSLWMLFRDHAERAYDLTWLAAVEEHFLGESLAVLGRMNGMERIARMFIRLHDRCLALGLDDDGAIPLPYRQQDVADALGMSLVHTNKMLRRLRETGLARWQDGWLRIGDYAGLCALAQLEADREPLLRPLI